MVVLDSITKFPILTSYLNMLIEKLKNERRLGIISVKLSMINYIEEIKGWETYDLIISEYASIIKNAVIQPMLKTKTPIDIIVKYERSDEFLLFVPINDDRFKNSISAFDEYIRKFEDFLRIRNNNLIKYIGSEEIDLIIGKSIVDYKGIVRTERLIYDAIETARLDTSKQLEKDIKLHKAELKTIIAKKRIEAVYQPIIDLIQNRIYGFEALSRFDTESTNFSTEGIFILAMKLNLTKDLERICREIAVLSSSGLKDQHYLFINLDPYEIIYNNINIAAFISLLKENNLDASKIVFEITERRFIEDLEDFNLKFDMFRKEGFKIAIDDVGAGYSSLNTIAVIKPDYMKIDINLIRDINKDFVKKEIVKTLMQFAKKINSKVLSEGIETKAEVETLNELGSELGQGYFFGKPGKSLALHYVNLKEKLITDV